MCVHSCCGILFCDVWILQKKDLIKIQIENAFENELKKNKTLSPLTFGPVGHPFPSLSPFRWHVGPPCQLLLPSTAALLPPSLPAGTASRAGPAPPRPSSSPRASVPFKECLCNTLKIPFFKIVEIQFIESILWASKYRNNNIFWKLKFNISLENFLMHSCCNTYFCYVWISSK